MLERALMSEEILCIGPLCVIPAMLVLGLVIAIINKYRQSSSRNEEEVGEYIDSFDDVPPA